MQEDSLRRLRQYADTGQAAVVDHRTTGGEVVAIPLFKMMQQDQALIAAADNVEYFMERVTGRGYRKSEEVYGLGYTVREPGHQAFGVKVLIEENSLIVARVAILEDETIFARYVEYLKTGVLV